jgi:hypothetical protein
MLQIDVQALPKIQPQIWEEAQAHSGRINAAGRNLRV